MKWAVLNSQRLVERPWVGIREDKVRFENGLEQEITVVENGIGVHVLAITEGNVILVDKVAYPAGLESSLELPGGGSKSGDHLINALKEFSEETGFYAKWCRLIMSLHKGPFRFSHPEKLYLATGIEPITDPSWLTDKDENELLNGSVILPINEAVEEVGERIKDTFTAAAILWLKNELRYRSWDQIY